jgi:hypothetical protein
MHRYKLVGLALLAILVFASVSAGAAMAEEPLLLVLTGEKVSELKYTGETEAGTKTLLETTSGKTIKCVKAKASASFQQLGTKEGDSETGTSTIDFEGCKQGEVACRSENAKAEKDPAETILTPLGLTGASEETSAKALQFILVNTISESPLRLVCGVVKDEIKGNVACLVAPALKEIATTEKATIKCIQEAKGKQVTGKCVLTAATCKKLETEPLLSNLGTGVFEVSGEEISVAGSFNKMVFLDD